MKEKAFLSAVVYCHNGGDAAAQFASRLDEYLDSQFDNYEIIVVNDASTDGTAAKLKKAAAGLRRELTVVNLAWRHGPQGGILAGVDLAIGDFVVEIEIGKANFGLELVRRLYEEASSGYDIVAARGERGAGLLKGIFYRLFNAVSYLPFDVGAENVRIVSRRAINAILGMDERVIHRGILYRYSGFPVKAITYEPAGTAAATGPGLRERMGQAFEVMVSFSNVGTDFSFLLALFFFVLSALLGVYAAFTYLTGPSVVPGWTTTVLFLSVCFCGVFLVLGLQGRYLSSMLLEIKRRPSYTVKSVERHAIAKRRR